MRLGAAYNPSGNPNAQEPGTCGTGKGQLDGGMGHPGHPPTAMSGAPSFVSQHARVPVASLSSNAAQVASVTSQGALTPYVVNPHCSVPAKGTSMPSVVPLSQGTISTKGTRASCAVPLGHDPSSAKGTRAHSDVPLSRGTNSVTGVGVSKTPSPSTLARERALRAPLHPATRRRVSLLSERVHPLLSLTMSWRSV